MACVMREGRLSACLTGQQPRLPPPGARHGPTDTGGAHIIPRCLQRRARSRETHGYRLLEAAHHHRHRRSISQGRAYPAGASVGWPAASPPTLNLGATVVNPAPMMCRDRGLQQLNRRCLPRSDQLGLTRRVDPPRVLTKRTHHRQPSEPSQPTRRERPQVKVEASCSGGRGGVDGATRDSTWAPSGSRSDSGRHGTTSVVEIREHNRRSTSAGIVEIHEQPSLRFTPGAMCAIAISDAPSARGRYPPRWTLVGPTWRTCCAGNPDARPHRRRRCNVRTRPRRSRPPQAGRDGPPHRPPAQHVSERPRQHPRASASA